MKTVRVAQVLVLVVSAMAFAAAPAASKKEFEEAASYDGLTKAKVKGIDLAYTRPGSTLAAYGKVMLDPVTVAFRKDWDPDKTGSRQKLSNQERQNIKGGVAKAVYQEFARELQEKSTYKVVAAPGPDVLRVKADIIDLYVNAPDTMTAGSSRVYAVSAGEMTLVAELFDSETGQVIARVIDRREARDTGTLQLTNSVVNASEVTSIASSWARILRSRLDAARGMQK